MIARFVLIAVLLSSPALAIEDTPANIVVGPFIALGQGNTAQEAEDDAIEFMNFQVDIYNTTSTPPGYEFRGVIAKAHPWDPTDGTIVLEYTILYRWIEP